MYVQQCVKAQIIWKWVGGGNVMKLGVKYWGRDVKGRGSEINSDCRNSFRGAFYSFLSSFNTMGQVSC